MIRYARFILIYFFLLGCVEPIEFVVEDNDPYLVVEGYISDKSYSETLLYPSDGPDKLSASCKGEGPFVPPPGCMSCLEYTNGVASNTEPAWWRE